MTPEHKPARKAPKGDLPRNHFNEARIKAVKAMFEDKKFRPEDVKEVAPWVVAGFDALERGEELTPELLNQADISQNTVAPEPSTPKKRVK